MRMRTGSATATIVTVPCDAGWNRTVYLERTRQAQMGRVPCSRGKWLAGGAAVGAAGHSPEA
jgi:hypothetical protein